MKKLIILFCGTLALAACGNGLEKKANEKLMVAKYQDSLSQSVRST